MAIGRQTRPVEHDGNGWVQCGLGHRHWGRFGGAGLMLRRLPAEQPEILMQHRALWTADGGTWGLPGGARDSHESVVEAALREAGEEAGIQPADVAVGETFVDDHGAGWSYTTVLADLVRPLVLVPRAESEELRWVAVAAVDELALHPGFAVSWRLLRPRLG
jgi:8-oxo-dGTP diphosphatase